MEVVTDFLLLGSKVTADGNCSHEIRRHFLLGRKATYDKQCTEKQRHYSADKDPYNQGYGLPSGHIQLWELDFKEGEMPRNWCLRTMVLEKTPGSQLDSKEIEPVHLKGNQAWILVGRTDTEAETRYFGHLVRTDDSLKSPSCWERSRAEGE